MVVSSVRPHFDAFLSDSFNLKSLECFSGWKRADPTFHHDVFLTWTVFEDQILMVRVDRIRLLLGCIHTAGRSGPNLTFFCQYLIFYDNEKHKSDPDHFNTWS